MWKVLVNELAMSAGIKYIAEVGGRTFLTSQMWGWKSK
jgi:hypothetical protein